MTSPSCTTVKRPGKTSKRPVQNRTEEQQQLPMPPKRQKIEGCGENNAGLESRPSDANGNFPQGQQKQEQTKPTAKVKQQTSIRFQHLYAMAHLCPITITEFKTHTNVDELVSNMCQKLYGDPSTNASAQLKRLYIFFYLKPNSRKSYPLSRLKMLPTCPENLRKKILEIPQLEPESTTDVPNLNKVHNQMDPTNACSENTNVNGTLNREGSSKLVNNPLLDRLPDATETGNFFSETQSQQNEIGETNIILPSPNSSSTTIAKKISANRVEILENILIPSNYPRVGSKVPHNRSFHHNDCRSCNLTLNEFQKHSNVLSVVDHSKYGSTKDEAVFNIYQLFLKDDDAILEINPPLSVEVAFWKKLAKFKIFCEQCRVKLESKSTESQHIVANEDNVPQPQNTVQPEEILFNQFQHIASNESSVPQPEEILSNQVQHNKETLEISIGNPLISQEVQEQNLAAASQPTEKFNQVQPNLNSSTLRETENLPLSINQSTTIAAVDKEIQGVPPNVALPSLMEAQDMLSSINQSSNSIAAVAKERREEISNVAVPAFIETEDLPSISIQTVAVEKEKQEAVLSVASKAKTKILQEKISEKDTAINSQTFRNQPQDKTEPTFENILNQISINQKWFSEFKSVLLKRINSKLIDSSVPTMPLPLKTFKILSYYHLPVKNILSDFCGNNEELKAFLENDQELFAGLVSLYYNKYFTNPKFRDKYPLRIKSCPSCMQKKMLSFVENRINDKKEAQKGHSVDATTALEKTAASNPHNPSSEVAHQTPCVPNDPQSYAISADSLRKPTTIIERNLMNSIPPILVSEEKLRKLNMRLKGGPQCKNRLKIDKNLFPNNNETCEQTVEDDSVLLSQQQEQDHQENSQSTSKDSISTKSVEQNIMKDALQNERIINEDGLQLNHSAVKTFFTVQTKETTKNNLNIECTKKKGSTVETNSSSTSFRSAAQEHSETSKSNKTSKTITKEGSRTEVSQLSAAAEPKDLTKNSKADKNFLQNKSQTSDQNVSDDTILLSQQKEQSHENSKSTPKDSTSPKSVQQSDIRKNLQNETIISIKASEPKQSTARGRPKSLSALQTKETTKKSTMVIKTSGTSLSSGATQHCGISKSNRTTKTATKEGIEVKQLSAAANSNMVENIISFDKQNVKQTSKDSASQELDANMEQVKATIFKYYTKDYSLPYMLRTSFGLKQKITQMIQDLDFKTFSKITHIYKGAKLFDDTAMLKHIYDYAVKSPGIWSKNLFIKLPDFCKLLQANGTGFSEAERIKLLEYISPRFLHWSELKTNTNFVEMVRKNYFKENFQNLNDADEVVKKACSEYYSQCWVLDKWIENVPLVDENILKEVPLSGKFAKLPKMCL
ncbi:uncharacterized protein LOC106082757 [Stomoxys calcitrans]|uniref:uncharacterized protein LOC106082757 n=1 Tax=Stomoxys calcitrans TaxID=35570 RepID=UPI0027E2259F|nr:uncharacterized protein LOC106082757 [Stomoxys calcitrans]